MNKPLKPQSAMKSLIQTLFAAAVLWLQVPAIADNCTPGTAVTDSPNFPAGWSLIANSLNFGGAIQNRLGKVLSAAPAGSRFFKWDNTFHMYLPEATKLANNWFPNVPLAPGEGGFLDAPTAFSTTLTGTAPNPRNYGVLDHNGLFVYGPSCPLPAAPEEIVDHVFVNQDRVWSWEGASFAASVYFAGGWHPPVRTIKAWEGAFFRLAGSTQLPPLMPTSSGDQLLLDVRAWYPYPLRSPCCENPMTYVVAYRNWRADDLPAGATLKLVLPAQVTFPNGTPSPRPSPVLAQPLLSNPNTLTWTLPKLGGYQEGIILLPVDISGCVNPAVVTLNASASLTPASGTQTTTAYYSKDTTCSYDPNDKTVTPRGCGPLGFISPNGDLTYVVEFQNLGTGPASQVVIHDTVDANLDLSTLHELARSHPAELLVDGRDLTWTFTDINLPPASTDEPGSHGFVKYTIKQNSNLPVGTVIANQASIVFDLNAPLLTTTTINTITDNPMPVASFSVSASTLMVGAPVDFTYTGGTVGASFAWDFGPGATPATSTSQNPSGVVYATAGAKLPTLRVTLGGCESEPGLSLIQVLTPSSYTINVPGGGEYTAIANQLDHGNNTLDEVLPGMANGTELLKWDCLLQDFSPIVYTYDGASHHWSPSGGKLVPGEGALLGNPGADTTVTFSGLPHVPVFPLPSSTDCGCGVMSLLSRQTNSLGNYESITGHSPPEGATIFRWDPTASDFYYPPSVFSGGVWSPSVPSIAIGESVFISTPCPTNPCITMTCAPNKTVPCGTAWSFDALTNITDSCCANLTLTFSDLTNSGPCPWVYTRTWLASDACGHSNTCSQTVTVNCCTNACPIGVVSLNTGFNHPAGAVYPVGTADAFWRVVSDPDLGTTEPRPATVITKNSAWHNPQPNSQWISSYATADDDRNGAYDFQSQFCLATNYTNLVLNLCLYADDWAEVFLNGVKLLQAGDATHSVFNPASANCTNLDVTAWCHAGANYLLVRVHNEHSVAMGLNLTGTVSGSGLVLEKPECCQPGASVSGRKFSDLNGNGVWDAGEPALAGWTIHCNGQTVQTDANGYYYFLNLPADHSYTVTEDQQTGWVQTAPAGGSYTLFLTNSQAVNNLNFGNQTNACPIGAVSLNTGFNHPAGTVYPIGTPDAFWRVVSDPDVGTTEPRPATVITKHVAWAATQANSQWISSYATADDELNGSYDFQTQFCLATNYNNILLSICLRADDWAEVYFNGVRILQAGSAARGDGAWGTPSPICTNLNVTVWCNPGKNYLLVRVHNEYSVAMGLNLTGTVSGSGLVLEKPECCQPGASVSGRKFSDLNGNGAWDAGEPALARWTIHCNNQTVQTDANGYYYFLNLPADHSYTVSEEQRPGWVQTAPTGGSYTLFLTNSQAVNNLNFGNQTNACPTGTVSLNTGFNHPAGTVYPIGAADAFWRVVSDPDLGTTEPRPATVITKHVAWGATQANSQWISSYATADDELNGAYDFQTQFCLATNYSNILLSLCLRADDWAEVFFNGVKILQAGSATLGDGAWGTPSPICTNLNVTVWCNPGKNYLLVRVHNEYSVAMGLNLTGTVSGSGLVLEKPECCQPGASVSGRKFSDLNGNGVWDAGEPALAGWTIHCNNQTVQTDANGYYYFLNLPAEHSYTVTEDQQAGWVQTSPAGGSYSLFLTNSQAVNNLNFGNWHTANTNCLQILCPSNIVVDCNSNAGAFVTYAIPTATNHCCPGPVSVVCDPPSGWFPIGITTVTCTAYDSCTNYTPCSFTVTVTGHGAEDWKWAHNAGGMGADSGNAVAVDNYGNVFVTGSYTNSMSFPGSGVTLTGFGGNDIFLAEYDAAGTLLWTVRAGGTGQDRGFGVAVDNDGNSYVTGQFTGTATFESTAGGVSRAATSSGNGDIFIAKYGPNGHCLWVTRDGGTGDDYGTSIAVTSDGKDAYFTGSFTVSGVTQAFVRQVNGSTGALIGGATPSVISSPTSPNPAQSALGNAVAVDSYGRVFVGGSYAGATTFEGSPLPAPASGGYLELFLAGFNPGLTAPWVRHGGSTFATNASCSHYATGIAVDTSGQWCYFTAAFNGTANFGNNVFVRSTKNGLCQNQLYDYLVAKFDANTGTPQWVVKGGGSPASSDESRAITVGPDGNPSITGFLHPNAPSPFVNEGASVLVVSLNAVDGTIRWSRNAKDGPLGPTPGAPEDIGFGIAADHAGCVHVTGAFTEDLMFPPNATLVPTLVPFPPSIRDMFVAKMCPTCSCPVVLVSAASVMGPYDTVEVDAVLDQAAGTITVKQMGAARFYRVRSSCPGIPIKIVSIDGRSVSGSVVIRYQFQ